MKILIIIVKKGYNSNVRIINSKFNIKNSSMFMLSLTKSEYLYINNILLSIIWVIIIFSIIIWYLNNYKNSEIKLIRYIQISLYWWVFIYILFNILLYYNNIDIFMDYYFNDNSNYVTENNNNNSNSNSNCNSNNNSIDISKNDNCVEVQGHLNIETVKIEPFIPSLGLSSFLIAGVGGVVTTISKTKLSPLAKIASSSMTVFSGYVCYLGDYTYMINKNQEIKSIETANNMSKILKEIKENNINNNNNKLLNLTTEIDPFSRLDNMLIIINILINMIYILYIILIIIFIYKYIIKTSTPELKFLYKMFSVKTGDTIKRYISKFIQMYKSIGTFYIWNNIIVIIMNLICIIIFSNNIYEYKESYINNVIIEDHINKLNHLNDILIIIQLLGLLTLTLFIIIMYIIIIKYIVKNSTLELKILYKIFNIKIANRIKDYFNNNINMIKSINIKYILFFIIIIFIIIFSMIIVSSYLLEFENTFTVLE